MSRIVKVSEGDYIVQVRPGGTITLDTGNQVGTVIMTGNLDVKGTSTTINTTDLSIEDNIITLNSGETGNGVTLTTSGIEVYRGPNSSSYPTAQILFDESVYHYNPVISANAAGTFVLKTKDGVLNGLQTNSITTAGTSDLVFDLKNQAYVLKVVNTTDYHSRVTLDDHIPNRKFITTYVAATGGVADVDKIYNGTLAVPTSEVLADVNAIKMYVQQSQRAQITSGGLSVDNVNVYNNTITNTSASNNLILTATTSNVEVNGYLNLDDQGSDPASTSGKNKLYSKASVGPGKTGIFYVNNTTSDELVAKNRALLFSMIF